jgi:hypothetical protein
LNIISYHSPRGTREKSQYAHYAEEIQNLRLLNARIQSYKAGNSSITGLRRTKNVSTVISFVNLLERWNILQRNIKGPTENIVPDGSALEANTLSMNVASATGTNFPLTCHLQNRNNLTCWHACAVMHCVPGCNNAIAARMTQRTGVTKNTE